MRLLQFMVDNQKLTRNGDFSHIIRGTKGYLRCFFEFHGNEWTNCNVVAIFEKGSEEFYERVSQNGMCKVPDEVTDNASFRVKLVGARNNIRLTTNKILISQEG